MNKQEYLLTCLSEECAEVSQRASKCIRFGLTDCDPEDGRSAAHKLHREIADVLAILEMLSEMGIVHMDQISRHEVDAKKARVSKFMEYSRQRETLSTGG